MRGQLFRNLITGSGKGITPADAGTTGFIHERNRLSPDHPRGCGDNARRIDQRLINVGSPPRMRGQQSSGQNEPRLRGITPADAGTTSAGQAAGLYNRDHPRGCGDNFLGIFRVALFRGSPPRMRGQPDYDTRLPDSHGITPADAGTTKLGIVHSVQCTDHPRGCGDNGSCGRICIPDVGSPPRMRGQLSSSPLTVLPSRITPADAGTTR